MRLRILWSRRSAPPRGPGASATARCLCCISKERCGCGPAKWAPTHCKAATSVDFTHYLNLVLQKREGQVELWQLVRNFSKWFFDLLRNFVLVGGLKYFYEKSGTRAGGVIFFYCLSYADQWYVNLFGFLKDRRLAHWLNRAVNFGIAAALFLAIRWGVSVIVAEISHAQV